jgi:hypothetical protein
MDDMTLFLVVTRTSQGYRKNDFCFAQENELVGFGTECDSSQVDDSCGCKRAMIGMTSLKGTTTTLVKEVPHSEEELRKLYFEFLERGGWDKIMSDAELEDCVRTDTEAILQVAKTFGVGHVIERRGETFIDRAVLKGE